MKLKGHHVHISCDSDSIQEFLSGYTSAEISVLPIPHTKMVPNKDTSSSLLTLWWPGKPKKEKGLSEVFKLSQNLSDESVQLLASEECPFSHFFPLPHFLTEDEYVACMQKADVVLLPYDPEIYRLGTSGIFIETICAGKIPVVKAGSWLARELIKHNVPELIIDWDDPKAMYTICSLARDPQIRSKLDLMQRYYQKFHSPDTYAHILNGILEIQPLVNPVAGKI